MLVAVLGASVDAGILGGWSEVASVSPVRRVILEGAESGDWKDSVASLRPAPPVLRAPARIEYVQPRQSYYAAPSFYQGSQWQCGPSGCYRVR